MTQRAYGLNFYILPTGVVHAWQGQDSCSLDPVVASLGTLVYANPALLHHALSTGDSTLYALQQEYGFCWDGISYYEGYKVAGSRWFLGGSPAAMLQIIPFSTPAVDPVVVVITPGHAAITGGLWGRGPGCILGVGGSGAWDSYSCYNPRIVKNLDGTPHMDGDGFYYMFYVGSNTSTPNQDDSGLAKSASIDALSWTKVSTSAPILARGAGIDAGDCQVECALFDGTIYHVWYDANSATSGGDQVSIAYATGVSLTSLTKQGVVVTAVSGEDYYAAQVIPDGTGFSMFATRHVGSVFGIVRLDATSLAGPWIERSGWAFTHSSGVAFLSSIVKDSDGGLHLLYSVADNAAVRSAYAPSGGTFVDMGLVFTSGATWDAGKPVYSGNAVLTSNVEHIFYNTNTTGGIGHAFAPF